MSATDPDDILERAKRVQRDAASDRTIYIKLSFLQDLIAEIERLRTADVQRRVERFIEPAIQSTIGYKDTGS